MNHPRITITANGEKDGEYTKHDTSISWTIAFIRFAEPASAYASSAELDAIKPILIVENDCVSVNITNQKSSFAKTCNLSMKVTDNWYQSNVNPGDWVFVWLNNEQDKNNEIQKLLGSSNFKNQKALNGFDSGLKFVGRVLSLGAVDSITSSGTRTLTQSVNCQAFIELASSIYYSYLSSSIINASTSTPSGNSATLDKTAKTIFTNNALNKEANTLTDFAGKFLSLYSSSTSSYTPDSIIGYLFALTMGVSRAQNPTNAFLKAGIDGTFNDAITIPAVVGKLLGNFGATRLCQIYQVILGLQRYSNTGNVSPALKLNPDVLTTKNTLKDNNAGITSNKQNYTVIHQTPARCSGFVPFYPPPWDNTPIWDIMTPYLNPVVNEMYTALRINKDGIIMPTLIVREKPLSTGLYHALEQPKLVNDVIAQAPEKKGRAFTKFERSSNTDKTGTVTDFGKKTDVNNSSSVNQTQRTMFGELPRWAIDESMIKSVSTATSESKRINFVQVWGKNAGAEFNGATGISSEAIKQGQMAAGNYRADVADIKRHGLRASIMTSLFDTLENGSSAAPEWAKRRADWEFNGHLKLSGTITCIGIQEPICEGDNVEVRGIVYHIDSVSHSASISSRGVKTFTTTLHVSNGLVAKSLEPNKPPSYACHLSPTRSGHEAPGFSEVQTRHSDKKRNSNGDQS